MSVTSGELESGQTTAGGAVSQAVRPETSSRVIKLVARFARMRSITLGMFVIVVLTQCGACLEAYVRDSNESNGAPLLNGALVVGIATLTYFVIHLTTLRLGLRKFLNAFPEGANRTAALQMVSRREAPYAQAFDRALRRHLAPPKNRWTPPRDLPRPIEPVAAKPTLPATDLTAARPEEVWGADVDTYGRTNSRPRKHGARGRPPLPDVKNPTIPLRRLRRPPEELADDKQ